jgi:phage terminase large subunit-like protein
LIATTEGNITDYDVVREAIRDFAGEYALREIPYDRWNATQLATQLESDGATLVQFPQGFSSMNEPSRLLESLVLSGKLRHGGNPVLRWMMANAAVKSGPNNTIRPVKGNPNARIDGIVALVMALGRAMVHQVSAPTSEPAFWDFDDVELDDDTL